MNYKSTLRKSAFEGSELQEAGGINLGATHAQVGAYLLWLWNLPDLIITAAVYHHNPQDHPAKKFAPVTAVHLANGFDHEMRHLKTESKALEINIEYIATLGIDNRVEEFKQACKNALERSQETWKSFW